MLAQSILALASAMNLRTIGEGIETDAQLQALKRMGCEMGQGFHLARPAPIAEMLAALRRIPRGRRRRPAGARPRPAGGREAPGRVPRRSGIARRRGYRRPGSAPRARRPRTMLP